VLTSFIDVKNIPKAYGGELEWDFFDEPRWDDAEFQRIMTFENGHTEVPTGPVYLRPRDDGRIDLLAVGSKDKKNRSEVFATIPKAVPVKKEAPSTATAATTVENEAEDATAASTATEATTVETKSDDAAVTSDATETAAAPTESKVDTPLPLTNGDVPKTEVIPPTEDLSKLKVADAVA
jgi:hypothetical protein